MRQFSLFGFATGQKHQSEGNSSYTVKEGHLLWMQKARQSQSL
jgi:hypothetical protein